MEDRLHHHLNFPIPMTRPTGEMIAAAVRRFARVGWSALLLTLATIATSSALVAQSVDSSAMSRTADSTRRSGSATRLNQIVVTAARRAQRLRDVVTTTEVVTREDIERSGASDLASVLIEQAGIELQGGHPAGSGVMLQGLGSERVLVLLDGQPVAGRISGVFDISRIPTTMVERVEVVKGPQSTLYGTEAMGGVINVITRTPEMHAAGVVGASMAATAGSQAQRDGSAGLTFGRGTLSSAFNVSRRNIGTTPGVASGDGALSRRLDAAGKLRWAPDSARSVEASILALDERQQWRSGARYNFADNDQWSARLGGSWSHGRHRIAPTMYASVFDHRLRGGSEPRPIAGDTGQRQLQRIYQGELLYNGRFGASGAHALDAGVQLRRDETESANVPGGLRSLVTLEPFAQAELAAGSALSLAPGIRVSRNSQWGTHVTPRLALRYRTTDRLTIRASAGEGYRAPDFKELYMDFLNDAVGYAVHGNPGLRPESSRNVTAGAEWAGARTYVRGQLYWNHFRDFIETRLISGAGELPTYQYANVADGSTRGIEIEAGASVAGLRLEGSYDGLATRDDNTGASLLGRPGHAARATLGITLAYALRTSLSGIFTGRAPVQRDRSGAVTSWRDSFLRADLRVARSLPGGLELSVGADNLFDRQPDNWAGFTGRHVYTALSWTMTDLLNPTDGANAK